MRKAGYTDSEMEDLWYDGKGLKAEMIDPKKAVTTQEFVHKDYAQGYSAGDSRDPVIVVEHNGEYLFDDGNHRAAAALAHGKKLKAYVIHTGEDIKPKGTGNK